MTAMTPTILEPRSGCPRISLRKTFAKAPAARMCENMGKPASQFKPKGRSMLTPHAVKYCVGQKLV